MNKWTKRIGCGCGVLLVLAVVAAIVGAMAIDNVLKTKLGQIINDQVLPIAREKLQVDVALKDVTVNVGSCAVGVKGVKIGNPKGFVEPDLFTLDTFSVDLGVVSSVKAGLQMAGVMKKSDDARFEVSLVELKDANLTIIRNEKELINVKVLIDTLTAGQPPAEKPAKEEKPKEVKPVKEEKPKEEKPAGPIELPPALLAKLGVSTLLTYIDYPMGEKGKPMQLALKMNVDVRKISTEAAKIGENGTVAITGGMATDMASCKTDIKGWIAPIGDPLKASFDIGGDIGKINLDFLRPYLLVAGVTACDSVGIKLKMVVKDGVFDRKQTVVTLVVENAYLTGSLAKMMPAGANFLPRLTVPLHIGGTLAKPEPDDPISAFVKAVGDNLKDNAGALLTGAALGAITGQKSGALSGGLGAMMLGSKQKDSSKDAAGAVEADSSKKEAAPNPLSALTGGDKKEEKKDSKKAGAPDIKKSLGLPF